MQSHNDQHDSGRGARSANGAEAKTYPPLSQVSRLTVDTNTAAFHLGRRPQTLRAWACHEDGPIRPVRINRRLAWPVADLIRVQQGGR